MSLLLATLLTAGAVEPELVLQRVSEVSELRAIRLEMGAPPIAESAYVEAAGGRIPTGLVAVPGHAAKKAWGVAVLDIPIGQYWAAVNDDQGKMEHTKLTYAEVLQGGLCGAKRRVFQFLSVPMLTDRWWIIDVRANTALWDATGGRVREQTWATNGDWSTPTTTSEEWAAKGMHVDETRGAWMLIDLDGKHTLIEYYTWADAGGAIPAGLASSFAARGIDDTLRVMADLGRQGGNCPVR